ncbi:unnamed protein product [Paramecium octaurelia]|uniref:Uncharacterized protein n=1 Tax=Paramecium octaurelia TaxID=43137 RepID=A0A8S1X384_PAROT|nr:unnamed protein product [Paramecium octaurelia]
MLSQFITEQSTFSQAKITKINKRTVKGWRNICSLRQQICRNLYTIVNQQEITYVYNGSILRIDKNYEGQQQMTNFEQINYLYWKGCYGNNNQRVGYWMATWDGEALTDVGGHYNDDGRKEGNWVEILSTFCTLSQVYEIGEYENGLRKGRWKYVYQNKEIGGGEYCQFGEKKGHWKELQKGFQNCSQVFYHGEYQSSKKFGRWDISWINPINNKPELIGSESYDEQRKGIQVGPQIELSDEFNVYSQITYNGECKNGKKVGRWDIMYREHSNYTFKLIGGGSYDELGQGIKIGKWIELFDGFYNNCQVTYNGQYKSGKKVGRWDIMFRDDSNYPFQLVGGGSYYLICEGFKLGKWIELSEGFDNHSQVIYIGEYKNGKKVGRWDVMFREHSNHQFEMIGGGSFDDKCNQIKQGRWIELSDDFQKDSSVIYDGQYQNGKKVGRWDILLLDFRGKKNLSIGGGLFNKQDFPLKQGKWIELSNGFQHDFQLTFIGDYQNGKKVGRWDIMFREDSSYQFKLIGGGSYGDKCNQIKQGQWVELQSQLQFFFNIIYYGEFNNGIKVGRWNIYYKNCFKNSVNFMQINLYLDMHSGGGSYDKGGKGKKLGKWTLPSHTFCYGQEITWKGKYRNGKKVGQWDIFFRDVDVSGGVVSNQYIGGGIYEKKGEEVKVGYWIELWEGFDYSHNVIFKGEYKNGKKVGRWNILHRVYRDFPYYQIGGGFYDDQGDEIKNGKWIEWQNDLINKTEVIYQGEYENGKKIGLWDILYKDNLTPSTWKQIGGGLYDERGEGTKHGRWIDLSEKFDSHYWVTFNGQYKNDKKVGRWDIWHWEWVARNLKLIGGGEYDEKCEGSKIGNWIELSDEFQWFNQVVSNGQYHNGERVGKWENKIIRRKET